MNTISTKTWRDKYRSATLEKILRRNLIARAICEVDTSGSKTIQSPYGSQPSSSVQALSGHYVVDDFTGDGTTDYAIMLIDTPSPRFV